MTDVDVGQDIDSYCNKCKRVLAHVIIAMKDVKPGRVECKTCNGAHAYKATAPKKRGAATAETKKINALLVEYKNAMAGKDISQARRYKISESFEPDDIMDHKKFGVGLVSRVLVDSKIEVVFNDGTKVLVHQR